MAKLIQNIFENKLQVCVLLLCFVLCSCELFVMLNLIPLCLQAHVREKLDETRHSDVEQYLKNLYDLYTRYLACPHVFWFIPCLHSNLNAHILNVFQDHSIGHQTDRVQSGFRQAHFPVQADKEHLLFIPGKLHWHGEGIPSYSRCHDSAALLWLQESSETPNRHWQVRFW